MREVVLDTETTGLDPSDGHRIVEVACLELINSVPSGETFQAYVNPSRDMPAEAEAVHGLTAAFLADKPMFSEIADDFLAFVDDSPLIIHNAEFDLKFLNSELSRLGRLPLDPSNAVDTLAIARRKFPGAQASLDALCRRFEIDNSHRAKHGALLDTELLAEVYLQLVGGRQPMLGLASEQKAATPVAAAKREARAARPHAASEAERAAHADLVKSLKSPIWSR